MPKATTRHLLPSRVTIPPPAPHKAETVSGTLRALERQKLSLWLPAAAPKTLYVRLRLALFTSVRFTGQQTRHNVSVALHDSPQDTEYYLPYEIVGNRLL